MVFWRICFDFAEKKSAVRGNLTTVGYLVKNVNKARTLYAMGMVLIVLNLFLFIGQPIDIAEGCFGIMVNAILVFG